jgi:SfnB family sulfur acquisition oxidoreductase
MSPGSHHAPAPTSFTQPTRVISSDAEAIHVAHEVARQLAPGASERDREQRLPGPELDTLSGSGLLAVTVPRTHGGADVSHVTVGRVFQILSAADPAIGQLPQNHFVFLDAIRQDGTPAQKDFFFREVLAGARFGNAQAERGSSSALDLRTRLTRASNGEYRLDGTKYYCTGAIVAHWIPVAALDDANRLVLAYVQRNAPGVEVRPDWNAMGQRVTFSGTTILTNVTVPAAHIVEHWRLFNRPSLFHSFASFLHAAIDVGIAQNALEDTATLLRSRKRPRLGANVDRPLDDPHVIMRFGQLATRFHAAEELLLRAAQLLDEAAPNVNAQNAAEASVAVSEAKAFSEDVAIELTSDLFSLVGSASTDDDLNLHRHWRNARTHTIHDANQWRYHSAGNYFLNGAVPGKPVRHAAGESGAEESSARLPTAKRRPT